MDYNFQLITIQNQVMPHILDYLRVDSEYIEGMPEIHFLPCKKEETLGFYVPLIFTMWSSLFSRQKNKDKYNLCFIKYNRAQVSS